MKCFRAKWLRVTTAAFLALSFFLQYGCTNTTKEYVPTQAEISEFIIKTERPNMGPLERKFWTEAIAVAATKHGIPQAILTAKIAQESRFNQNAVSSTGARCASQIMKMHYKDYSEISEIESCLDRGAEILAKELVNCGTIERALRCYYAGPSNSKKGTLDVANGYNLKAYSDSILAKVYLAEQTLKQQYKDKELGKR